MQNRDADTDSVRTYNRDLQFLQMYEFITKCQIFGSSREN